MSIKDIAEEAPAACDLDGGNDNGGKSVQQRAAGTAAVAGGAVSLFSPYAWVSACSLLGVLARHYLGHVSTTLLGATSAQAPAAALAAAGSGVAFHSLPANVVGCVVMGAAVACRDTVAARRFAAAFTGLTTGFCGCTTTFASWMVEAAVVAWAGAVVDGSGDTHVVRALLVLLVGLTASQGALNAGSTLAAGARLRWCPTSAAATAAAATTTLTAAPAAAKTTTLAAPPVDDAGTGGAHARRLSAFALPRRRGSTGGGVAVINARQDNDSGVDGGVKGDVSTTAAVEFAVGVAIWLLLLLWPVVHLATHGDDDDDGDGDGDAERLFVLARALLVAPAGAALRLWLGRRNARHPRFPAFTVVANVVSAATAAALFVAAHDGLAATSSLSPLARSWLRAVSLGFCGSLSTVSTFVAEARALRTQLPARHAWRYVVATIVAGQLVAAACLLPYFHHYVAT
jgi:fluoride ion exporter CrcB/FEX